MSRPDPIEYAERLYSAIRAANFSPMSFLAFGNAVKEGIGMRNMPRIAAEPFMRIVGEMLELEEQSTEQDDIIDTDAVGVATVASSASEVQRSPDIAVRESGTMEDVAKPDIAEKSAGPDSRVAYDNMGPDTGNGDIATKSHPPNVRRSLVPNREPR